MLYQFSHFYFLLVRGRLSNYAMTFPIQNVWNIVKMEVTCTYLWHLCCSVFVRMLTVVNMVILYITGFEGLGQ